MDAIGEIRKEQYASQYYNAEQALRAAVKYAYIVAFGQYVKVEEMPSGKGIADVVFIPAVLKPFAGNILLVGINYDEKTGKHTCSIEKA